MSGLWSAVNAFLEQATPTIPSTTAPRETGSVVGRDESALARMALVDAFLGEQGKPPQAWERHRGAPDICQDEVTLGKHLGSGSFGEVYAGKCRGKDVAVKKLKVALQGDALETFQHEVDIWAQLSHPNVCLFMVTKRFFSACCLSDGAQGLCPDQAWIVTELMTKGDFNQVLYSHELDLFTRVRMTLDAAYGLSWLHNGQFVVIHR